MALTVVGRFRFETITPICVAQDPTSIDRFYFLIASGGDHIFCSYTWGDAAHVEIVNLGTILANKVFTSARIDTNFSLLLGETDSTPHYVIFYGTEGFSTPINMKILEINCNTGAYTNVTVTSSGSGGLWQPAELCGQAFSMPTVDGTVFFTVYEGDGAGLWCGALYGGGASTAHSFGIGSVGRTPSPLWVNLAYGAFLGYDLSEAEFRYYQMATRSGSVLPTPIPAESVVRAALGATEFRYRYPINYPGVPARWVQWDDDWLYWFSSATISGIDELIYCRYNISTGAFSYVRTGVSAGGAAGLGNAMDALDIVESNDARTIYFGFSRTATIRRSLAWPFATTDSVDIDTGTTSRVCVHTAANGYVYAFSNGGSTYGNQIVKILDTNWEPDAAVPSLGGIGSTLQVKNKVLFFIGVPGYGRYLWWSQPMELQSLDVGWDGFNSTVFPDEDNVALKVQADTLYVGSKKGWMRLRGRTPDSWSIDPTQATIGPLSNKMACPTPFGIVYPREDGLWVFNEYTSALFFDKGKNLMANFNWNAYAKAFALWDGRFYRLFYPSGSAVVNDRELVVDLVGGLENARGTEGDRAAACGFVDLATKTIYLGDENGNLMTLGGGSGSRAFELTTKEFPSNGLVQAGQFSQLHYDIDTGGATVNVIPILDGVDDTARALPATVGRVRSSISLPKKNYFRIGFRIETQTAQAVKLYEPWILT